MSYGSRLVQLAAPYHRAVDCYEAMVQLGDEAADIQAQMAASVRSGEPALAPSGVQAQDRLNFMAFHHAALLVAASADHLRAVALIARQRVIPAFALMSLIRTSYECALLAQWLMDDVTADERRLRGLRVQFNDLVERRKFETAIGRSNAGAGRLAAERLQELLADASSLGLAVVGDDGAISPPASPPNVVELFDLYESRTATADQPALKGQTYYRLLSGYAHGKQWAMTLGIQRAGEPDGLGNTAGVVTANDEQTLALMKRATDRLRSASRTYLALIR